MLHPRLAYISVNQSAHFNKFVLETQKEEMLISNFKAKIYYFSFLKSKGIKSDLVPKKSKSSLQFKEVCYLIQSIWLVINQPTPDYDQCNVSKIKFVHIIFIFTNKHLLVMNKRKRVFAKPRRRYRGRETISILRTFTVVVISVVVF